MGARQTGKSTLVQSHPTFGRYPYLTLDRSDIRAQAHVAPESLLARAPRLVIDEVQRAPDLILALKEYIDRQPTRVPGQFVLTGSANLLAMKNVRESLAGRASYTTLWPMTRRERLGFGTAGLWDAFRATGFAKWPQLVMDSPNPDDDWRTLALLSGYPTPAFDCESEDARAVWYQGYIDTYLDRDLQELAAIAHHTDFRRHQSVIAVECKGGPRPGCGDAKSLRTFIGEYGDTVRGALLLHGGTETYQLGERILATPWWRVI